MTHETSYPKRLIEVDLPIKQISEHARREKSIRHGHISTMHLWWARRPLAACRAVICAALWPDPADIFCPQSFRDGASRVINEFAHRAATDKELAEKCSPQTWEKWQKLASSGGLDSTLEAHWNVLRFALLDFVADFSNWDNSAVGQYLETCRALTGLAHEALGGAQGTRPLVADPFAGGGSIPLEALRVGADAFASDLNPVAVLLNKALLEYIPTHGQRLADEIRNWGMSLRKEAEKEVESFYPKEPDGATPIAYLWARTIVCEGPGCGAEVPLIRSLWVKEGTAPVALKLIPRPNEKMVHVEIIENVKSADVKAGTVRRGSATCPCCGYTTPADRTRAQFLNRKGGTTDARLLAVVTTRPNVKGRFYRAATDRDLAGVKAAAQRFEETKDSYENGERIFPDAPLPYLRSIFNINLLGVTQWQQLFTPRQLLVIASLIRNLGRIDKRLRESVESNLCDAIVTFLGFAIDRQADYGSSLCRWVPTGEFIGNTFGRQALGIIWDFAETNPFGNASGNFEGAISWIAAVCERVAQANLPAGHVERASATQHPLPDDSADAFITDPPYYDAVPYADLSDFFYVWLKRSLGKIHPIILADDLSPKTLEVVQLAERNPIYAYKTKENFEKLMREALTEGRRIVKPGGIGVVVFAHKTTAAWETMLQAVMDAGWIIVASWAIDTEMGARLRARNSATLSSSVHLVCRPRETANTQQNSIESGDWREVLAELPRRIHDWMPRLSAEGVVGADAIFACLGPALEVFSRYAWVEKASGERVSLNDYLVYVWAAVAKEALNMIFAGADATGFEEDARLTAMWLWTLSTGASEDATDEDEISQEHGEEDPDSKGNLGGFLLEYDAARKIAQGLGADLESLTSLVEVNGDVARLLPVSERARHLFGREQGTAPTKRKGKPKQLSLLDALGPTTDEEVGSGGAVMGNTVLDRIHQSMILFGAGRGEALKRFLVADGAGQDQRFWRLAQALSALYPKGTDERRWVEGVLARKKGLGF